MATITRRSSEERICAMTHDKHANGPEDPQEHHATPEDVAALPSWSNRGSGGYRDFSVSREKARATFRERMQVERSGRAAAAAASAVAPEQDQRAPEVPATRPSTMPRTLKLAAVPEARPPGSSSQRGNGPFTAKHPRPTSARTGPARWAALNKAFERPAPAPPAALEIGIPVLAVVSLAGGVGKTSLVAALGRSLAIHGERVLLVDANQHGLLPLFFGAHELGTGALSTFANGDAAPLQVLTMEPESCGEEASAEHRLGERIAHHARDATRLLIDVSTDSTPITREVLRLWPTVLFTLTPDMASVVTLGAAHAILQRLADESGQPLKLFYILNQFDGSRRLHSDVHDLLAHQLGDRLLPFAIRRSDAVSEALAEGMTVVDYVPDSPIVEDIGQLCEWIHELDREPANELYTASRRES
jgi:cellulose synthase operon protein YhjQ